MSSVTLVYRPSIKKGQHAGSLSLRLIHERQVKAITLKGCRIISDEWDQDTHSILIPSDNPDRAAYLKDVISRINSEREMLNRFILMLENKGRYRLNDLLLLYLRQHSEGTLQGYTETLFKLLTSRGQYRTARAYRTVTHGLLSFHGDTHLSLKQIDARLMKDFESYLKNKGLMLNTISYYMRNLRAIYNKAVQENLIIARKEEDPFADVFTGVVKTVKRALSMDETSQLLNVDLEKHLCDEQPGSSEHTQLKKLQDAQRYFNFCLYARGMCFVDLAYLKKSDIKDGCIRYMRKKTGQRIEVEIAPALQTIIDSFADETSGSPYVFPLIRHADKPSLVQYESALRTQNNRLKRLAAMAGITKTLSTHVARHTWATVGKLINLSTMVLSECLGHSSEKTTSIYLGTLAGSTLDEANARVIQAIQNHRARV